VNDRQPAKPQRGVVVPISTRVVRTAVDNPVHHRGKVLSGKGSPRIGPDGSADSAHPFRLAGPGVVSRAWVAGDSPSPASGQAGHRLSPDRRPLASAIVQGDARMTLISLRRTRFGLEGLPVEAHYVWSGRAPFQDLGFMHEPELPPPSSISGRYQALLRQGFQRLSALWAMPEVEGHGTDAMIRAFHRGGGMIRTRVPLIKSVASIITIGTGGSAGQEGPI